MDKREMQAQATALKIALRQTDAEALAHLECVVGAILLSMSNKEQGQVMGALSEIETLAPAALSNVQIYGEVDKGVTPKRQEWRNELADLEAQIQTLPDVRTADVATEDVRAGGLAAADTMAADIATAEGAVAE